MADTTIKLILMDKVLLIILGNRNIFESKSNKTYGIAPKKTQKNLLY